MANKYDIQAKIDAVRADAERQVKNAQGLLAIMEKSAPDYAEAARKDLRDKEDWLTGVNDGTLFAQQPWLIGIGA